MEIEAGAGAPASDADGRHARAGATLELQDTKTSSSAEHGGGRRAPAPVSCRRRGVGRGAGRCRELSKTFVRLLKSGVGVSTGTRISVFIFLLAGIYRTHTKQVPFGGTVQRTPKRTVSIPAENGIHPRREPQGTPQRTPRYPAENPKFIRRVKQAHFLLRTHLHTTRKAGALFCLIMMLPFICSCRNKK